MQNSKVKRGNAPRSYVHTIVKSVQHLFVKLWRGIDAPDSDITFNGIFVTSGHPESAKNTSTITERVDTQKALRILVQ